MNAMTNPVPTPMTEARLAELQSALDKTKIQLFRKSDSAFYATIAFGLKTVWDDTQPTAYVDGVHMGWNPDFFLGLPMEERLGVMVHEASHIAYDHLGIGNLIPDCDRGELNKAADHVINLHLLARDFKLPSFRLADTRFAGMHTQEVYKILMDEKAQGLKSPSCGMEDLRIPDPGQDQNGQGKGPNGMTPDQVQQHVRDLIVRAATISKMQNDKPGTIPGEIELFLDNLRNPKLPWQTILRRYFLEFAKNDYSWKKPNRRFMPAYHLPSLYSQNLIDMDFYVDISGSVEDYQFKIFVSEIAGVLKHLKPKTINVIQFDTEVQHNDRVTNLNDLKNIQFHGRGGTDCECIFQLMEQRKPGLACIFTDGGFHFYRDKMPGQKILWLINDNPGWTAEFGDVIHFNTNEMSS